HAASKTEAKSEAGNSVRNSARGSLRLRLLSGAASLALPVASMMAIGICVPGIALAQTTVNPVQTTTFTLDPAQSQIIFGGGTNIDTTATVGSDGINGGNGTAWTVTNQGSIQGDLNGVFLDGAGSNLINSGSITATNTSGFGGVFLANGGAVTNDVNGTISGANAGVNVNNGTGTVTNS